MFREWPSGNSQSLLLLSKPAHPRKNQLHTTSAVDCGPDLRNWGRVAACNSPLFILLPEGHQFYDRGDVADTSV